MSDLKEEGEASATPISEAVKEAFEERRFRRAISTNICSKIRSLLDSGCLKFREVRSRIKILENTLIKLQETSEIIQDSLEDDECTEDFLESEEWEVQIRILILEAQEYLGKETESESLCPERSEASLSATTASAVGVAVQDGFYPDITGLPLSDLDASGSEHSNTDRKSTRLNSSHRSLSRMPSSA